MMLRNVFSESEVKCVCKQCQRLIEVARKKTVDLRRALETGSDLECHDRLPENTR
jgi:hypothetical protein